MNYVIISLVLFIACLGRVSASEQIIVVTDHLDIAASLFEEAFERRYPQYRVQLYWRRSDTYDYLTQPGQADADVVWFRSKRIFDQLKAANALHVLDLDLAGLPDHVGTQVLRDKEGYFHATQLGGYGLALNLKVLAALKVEPRLDWDNLLNPKLAGHIALADPLRVGYGPLVIEAALGLYGWDAGWAYYSELTGLAYWVGQGVLTVADEVGSGRAAVGFSKDNYIAASQANGAPITLRYSRYSRLRPGFVGILSETQHLNGAQCFAQFLVSPEGQMLLAHPDIRALPVRPATYTQVKHPYSIDPFAETDAARRLTEPGAFVPVKHAAQMRQLYIWLFDLWLHEPHERVVTLWQRLHLAEMSGKQVSDIRTLLTKPPVSEAELNSVTFSQRFLRDKAALSEQLRHRINRRYQQVADMLDEVR